MEIQNRDVLLQQILGTKFGNIVVSEEKGLDFAEMLKKPENQVNKEVKESFGEEKIKAVKAQRENIKSSVDDKVSKKTLDKSSQEDHQVKETKKDDQKPKKKETEPVAGVSQSNEVQKTNSSESEEKPSLDSENVVNEGNEIVNTEENVVEVSVEMKPEGFEIFQNMFAVDSFSVEGESKELGEPIVENEEVNVLTENTETPKMYNGEDVVSKEKPANHVLSHNNLLKENMIELSEDEELLLKPNQILGDKVEVLPNHKVEVEVSVQEEKIAALVEKDMVKNSFELKSMFQNVESDAFSENEFIQKDMSEDSMQVSVQENTDILPVKGGYAQETTSALRNETSKIMTNTIETSASAKEIVFEMPNVSRNETFARINEVSSRDGFQGMEKEVVEQIKVNITKSAVKGVDTIDIQLKPEDLGKIQIKMHIARDGKLHAEIISSRAETMDLLQREVSSLVKTFNDAGYDTDSKSFNFSFQGESFAEQRENNSERLQFVGDALEQEMEDLNTNDNLVYDPAQGLNIRV